MVIEYDNMIQYGYDMSSIIWWFLYQISAGSQEPEDNAIDQ